jgi:hypothetical protein
MFEYRSAVEETCFRIFLVLFLYVIVAMFGHHTVGTGRTKASTKTSKHAFATEQV